jgi:hypothetical protein
MIYHLYLNIVFVVAHILVWLLAAVILGLLGFWTVAIIKDAITRKKVIIPTYGKKAHLGLKVVRYSFQYQSIRSLEERLRIYIGSLRRGGIESVLPALKECLAESLLYVLIIYEKFYWFWRYLLLPLEDLRIFGVRGDARRLHRMSIGSNKS